MNFSYLPSKDSVEHLDDLRPRIQLRLVELPDLNADVGPDVEVDVAAAVKE